MDIRFENSHTGYRYAIQLKKIIRLIEKNHLLEHFDPDFIQNLENKIETFLSTPEIAEFTSDEEVPEIILVQKQSFVEKLKDFFGPSKKVKLLGKQRIELIERAEHAENTAFETLAELAEIKNKLEEANSTIKQLREESSKRNPDK